MLVLVLGRSGTHVLCPSLPIPGPRAPHVPLPRPPHAPPHPRLPQATLLVSSLLLLLGRQFQHDGLLDVVGHADVFALAGDLGNGVDEVVAELGGGQLGDVGRQPGDEGLLEHGVGGAGRAQGGREQGDGGEGRGGEAQEGRRGDGEERLVDGFAGAVDGEEGGEEGGAMGLDGVFVALLLL